jgi:hypothetical protein
MFGEWWQFTTQNYCCWVKGYKETCQTLQTGFRTNGLQRRTDFFANMKLGYDAINVALGDMLRSSLRENRNVEHLNNRKFGSNSGCCFCDSSSIFKGVSRNEIFDPE